MENISFFKIWYITLKIKITIERQEDSETKPGQKLI